MTTLKKQIIEISYGDQVILGITIPYCEIKKNVTKVHEEDGETYGYVTIQGVNFKVELCNDNEWMVAKKSKSYNKKKL